MQKVILIVLLCFATAQAAQSPRRDSLRVSALRESNLPTTGTDLTDTTTVDYFVNTSIQQVCQDFPALQKFDTVYVDSASEGGALASDFDRLGEVSLMLDDTARIVLVPCGSNEQEKGTQQYDANQIADKDDDLSPRCYRVHDNYLIISPKWTRSEDTAQFLVQYFALDTTLTADSSETSVEGKYLRAVVVYTKALIAMRQGNYVKMSMWLKEYEGMK